MRRALLLGIAAVLAVLAAGSGNAHAVGAESQTQTPLIVNLAYAGRDPLGGIIFTARIANNSDEAITSGSVSVSLGYRWTMADADADGWTCTTTPDLTSSCTRAMSAIQPHLVDEFAILMGTAAGVCLTAAPEITVVAHFSSGDQTASAKAQAPSDCSSPLRTLPGTGTGGGIATHHDRRALASALALFAAGAAAIGLSLARRSTIR